MAGALVLSLLLALSTTHVASAHGGGKQQLAGQALGAYRVYVWTSPDPWRSGDTHTTVAVTRLLEGEQETPATGIQVFVTYARGGESKRIEAEEQMGAQAGFYEADGSVQTAGDWEVTVEVLGPEEGGTVTFTTAVLPANEVNWWLIGGAGLAALLALGYFGTRRTGRQPVQRGASS
jgi:hypothetical protein